MAVFGLTYTDVETRVQGLAFSVTSKPLTIAQVTAIISDYGDMVSGLIRSKAGIVPSDMASGDEGYGYARVLVLHRAVAEVQRILGRLDVASSRDSLAKEAEQTLRDWALALGDSAPTAAGSADIPFFTVSRATTSLR